VTVTTSRNWTTLRSAERRRVREELEHTPQNAVSPETTARYQAMNEEFIRRARLAWAQAG
jgi:hypothetical protein